MRSRRSFSIADHGSLLEASHAATEYASRYTLGQYPSHQAPRLFVVFDKVAQAYFIEPNLDFVPSRNQAWLALCGEEAR
jgi:hypothetical protein